MILTQLLLSFILVFSFYKTFHFIHMLQQNSYRNNRYIRWYKNNAQNYFLMHKYILTGIIFAAYYKQTLLSSFVLIGLTLMSIYLVLLKNKTLYGVSKKKLVYTSRVKRLITSIALFHVVVLTFVFMAPTNLLLYCFIMVCIDFNFIIPLLANTLNLPIENSIKNYYFNDAKKIIQSNKELIVIGITGSYGKTSTKNILYKLLSQKYHVLMTPRSYNTKMGVTITTRNDLKPYHQIYIVEMGAKEVNDIKEICDLVNPDFGIITAIGPQHLETFKSLDNIVKTKGELYDALVPKGKAFVNLSNDTVTEHFDYLTRHPSVQYISYGIDQSSDYKASDLTLNAKGATFKLNYKHTTYEFSSRLLGRHNIENIVGSIAIALELDVKPNKIQSLLNDIHPIQHRLSLRDTHDYLIIDDAFNSNPIGSKNALEILNAFEGNRKVIMTPGMIELGDQEAYYNEKFGEYIADVCHLVVLIGKKQTQPIQKGLKNKNYPTDQIKIFNSLSEGFKYVNDTLTKDDILLIENDLPDSYNE